MAPFLWLGKIDEWQPRFAYSQTGARACSGRARAYSATSVNLRLAASGRCKRFKLKAMINARAFAAVALAALATGASADDRRSLPTELTVELRPSDRASLLEEWTWLVGSDKVAIVVTPCGDAFLEDRSTRGIFFLDTQAARFEPVAASRSELRDLLSKPEFVADNFCQDAVEEMRSEGKRLGAGQVYSLKVPLVLGGRFRADNLEATNVLVHFSVLG